MRLAVIPARGGSKRIPRKNIKLFAGVPIIARSILVAIESKCFDRVIVSTDDNEIAEVAISFGAEVPFIRPDEFSGDYIGTVPVVAHAVNWQNAHGEAVTEACCIYATAPFISSTDLQSGLHLLQTNEIDYSFAVTSYAFPIQRSVRLTEERRVEMFYPEQFRVRSQDLEAAWHDAGQFYWGRAEAWIAEKDVFTSVASPVILPRYRVQDIDTLEDWGRAELMFKAFYGLDD